MTEQIADAQAETNIRTVETFLYALRDKNWDTCAALLDDDLVYDNVGYPTLRGGQRVVKFHRSTTDGASVMNERTDALMLGRLHMYFRVCGVFELAFPALQRKF